MSTNLKFTDEQQHIIDLSKQGHDICVRARAGTGKTSNLIGVANSTDLSGIVMVFLRNNASELNLRLPFNFEASTINSLAWHACGRQFGDRLKGRLTPKHVIETLGVRKKVGKFTPYRIASLVIKTMKNYCLSADEFVSDDHIPPLKKSIPKPVAEQLAYFVKCYADILWRKLISPKCELTVDHDVYLKLYQLQNPILEYDIIALDEGQDSNPVTISIFSSQYVQKIIVGDDFQQIYSWRGAVNALDSVNFDKNCYLTQSFRFGQNIAYLAMKVVGVYTGESIRLVGNSEIDSNVISFKNDSRPDIEICRTNTKILSRVVSLIESEPNIKICIKKGIEEIIGLMRGMMNMKQGMYSDCVELSSFDSWLELVEYADSGLGGDFVPLIKIINSGQGDKIIEVLEKIKYIGDHESDISFVTAHSSKGMEWNHVKLADDFPHPVFQNGQFVYPAREEINLLYVAVTRAVSTLDISDCFAALFAHQDLHRKNK